MADTPSESDNGTGPSATPLEAKGPAKRKLTKEEMEEIRRRKRLKAVTQNSSSRLNYLIGTPSMSTK